jgi:hypothetical protein
MSESFSIKNFRPTDHMNRPVAMASLGCHVDGAALPHPDLADARTACAGSMYRFCRKMPKVNRKKFRRFVRGWLKDNLTPLSLDCDRSFETWIANTPYTQARKKELTDKYNAILGDIYKISGKQVNVKSFIKDECYLTFKHARGINSRADEFKCVVGPLFQLISDKLFSLPWFIKKIPIHKRPEYILEMLEQVGVYYVTTDYTSFEAHFESDMMEDCEFQLYDYMTKALPENKRFMRLLRRVLAGTNHIVFKNFQLGLKGKRMSGEMCTSLGNGFSNLMFMLYLCELNGNSNVRGVIEGDDGLFVMKGSPPNKEVFDNFGLNIKIIKFADINHASFCGMVFDTKDRTNVTDPISELVSFGWTTARYSRSNTRIHMHLIRSKALSLAYQYPACPILTKFSNKMLLLTQSYNVKAFVAKRGSSVMNQYEKNILDMALEYLDKNKLNLEPGHNTRMLVQQLYGVMVEDQIAIEDYLDSMTSIQELKSANLDKYLQRDWISYFNTYSIALDYKTDINNLDLFWPRVRDLAELI